MRCAYDLNCVENVNQRIFKKCKINEYVSAFGRKGTLTNQIAFLKNRYWNVLTLLKAKSNLKVSEYEHEIPQSHTADQPMAPWGRATEHIQSQDIQKTIKAKQPDFSSTSILLQNWKGHKIMHNKTKTNKEPPQTMGVT